MVINMEKFLSEEEVHNLLIKSKSGDNDAWERIYKNFGKYVHERAWKRLRRFEIPDSVKREYEEDIAQAGWQGFIAAIRNFDTDKGRFLTYATHYIDGEISKELEFLFNPLGLTGRLPYKERTDNKTLVSRLSIDEENGKVYCDTEDRHTHRFFGTFDREAPDRGKYPAERRVLQILDILKPLTDEEHRLSKEELSSLLKDYTDRKNITLTMMHGAEKMIWTVCILMAI